MWIIVLLDESIKKEFLVSIIGKLEHNADFLFHQNDWFLYALASSYLKLLSGLLFDDSYNFFAKGDIITGWGMRPP